MYVDQLWTRPIWSDGKHNAFPGIARFGDWYYVTFRHSDGHQAPTATIGVIRSRAEDLDHWEQVAEFDIGADSRDPFVTVVNDHLHVYWHRKPCDWVSRSTDGTDWSEPAELDTEFPALPEGCDLEFTSDRRWLFRFRQGPDGLWYSAGRCGIASNGEPGLILYRSDDGLTWKAMHTFYEGIRKAIPETGYGGGHETDLAFLDDGACVAAIRAKHQGIIACSRPPYDEWHAYGSGVRNFGGPALHRTPHGLLLAARDCPVNEPMRCTIWTVTPSGLINPCIVPSGGDCAYQVFEDGPNGEILLCYYSSHEWPWKFRTDHPSSIYLARFRVRPGLECGF